MGITLAVLASAGYSLNGLWRVVERSIVWHTVRRSLDHLGLGTAIMFVVLLFVWKGYGSVRRYARKRTAEIPWERQTRNRRMAMRETERYRRTGRHGR